MAETGTKVVGGVGEKTSAQSLLAWRLWIDNFLRDVYIG